MPATAPAKACAAADPPRASAPERMRWAELMRRVFALDVLRCEHCGGRRKRIALIQDPFVARGILEHLGPAAAAFALLAAFLVLSPTLHPWYVTWIVPLLALRPSAAFVYLAAVAPLLYAPLGGWVARGEWHEPAWLWPVVALPFLALLARELVRPKDHPRAGERRA